MHEQTSIRFLDAKAGVFSVLEIQAPGDTNENVIRAVYEALLAARAQVVRYEYRSVGNRTRYRLRIVELDGGPVSPGRRLEIQSSLMGLADIDRSRHASFGSKGRIIPH